MIHERGSNAQTHTCSAVIIERGWFIFVIYIKPAVNNKAKCSSV